MGLEVEEERRYRLPAFGERRERFLADPFGGKL